jgi:antitoxin MazE
VRIPQWVIKECGLGDELEMRVDNGVVVLAPLGRVREGWDAAFETTAAAGDDALVTPDTVENEFDSAEWTW